MKINSLIILLVISFFNVNAQDSIALVGTIIPKLENTDKIDTRKGFSLEPIIGIGTSEAVQHGTNNLGWKIGCGVVYMFNNHWGVSSGLQVQCYSTKIVTKTDTNSIYNLGLEDQAYYITASYNFTYLELPVSLRYMSNYNGKFDFFFETGFIFDYLIYSKTEPTLYNSLFYPGTGGSSAGSFTYPFGWKNPMANVFDIQGHLAVGINIPISQIYSICTDISISKGFTNTGNSDNDFESVFLGTLYYYNNNNLASKTISSYGTNFSVLLSFRLNIKLGSK